MMNIRQGIWILWFSILFVGVNVGAAWAQQPDSTRRYSLLVGANHGGAGREVLRYAASDAQALGEVLVELGGVHPGDQRFLVEPTPAEMEQAIRRMGQQIASHQQAKGRAEFIFYYSGHSDERGLLLGEAHMGYGKLRGLLDAMPADVRLVILDSCASGSYTRAKGGQRMPAFLSDSANRVRGYAVLTSSSANEVAQESDQIQGSFFTHYLISGLRGAADVAGNQRVTLNEAYRYAFDETLARTHDTLGGAQHAEYDIQMSGHGELVLTALNPSNATLQLEKAMDGRVWLRNPQGRLVAEVSKYAGRSMELGLPGGMYRVELDAGNGIYVAQTTVSPGKAVRLGMRDFREVAIKQTRVRGGTVAAGDGAGAGQGGDAGAPGREVIGFGVDVVPGVGTSSANADAARAVSLNLVGGMSGGTRLFEVGGGFNLDRGPVHGAQIAGAFNLSEGLSGAQIAGAANVNAGETHGVQIAGALNAAQSLRGAQIAGAFNLSEGLSGAQIAGAANVNAGEASGVQIAGAVNVAASLKGTQVGGAVNYSGKEASGVQIAGGLNYRGGASSGLQIAGALNYVDGAHEGVQIVGGLNLVRSDVHGLQLGTINIAGGHVDGLQLGAINVSRTSDASIGVINIFRDGYVQPEVFGADDGVMMAGIRHGSGNFYSVYHVGARLLGDDTPFAYGLGFGWRRALRDTLEFSADLTVAHIVADTSRWRTDSLIKVRPMISVALTEGVSIFGGPTLSLLLADAGRDKSRAQDYALIKGWPLTPDDAAVHVGIWPGLTAGVRFF